MEMMGVEPSWFGQPVLGFAEVGERIANDIRFSQCTITQSLEMLYQRKIKGTEISHRLVVSNKISKPHSYKSIWKAILLSDEYRTKYAGLPVMLKNTHAESIPDGTQYAYPHNICLDG